jgi:hypothetical protein
MSVVGEVIAAGSGLAAIFNAALKCFSAVRVAKAFSDDYESAVLDLDNAQLRLSRWGDAVGLAGGGMDDNEPLPRALGPDRARDVAERTLRHIVHLFEEARAKAARIEQRQGQGQGQGNEDAEEDDARTRSFGFLAARDGIKRIVRQRQNGASVRVMAKWVIYNKDEFNALIAAIKKHTDDLEAAFPGLKTEEARLCRSEVEQLTETLKALALVAQKQDKMLAEQLAKMLEPVVRGISF